MTGSTPITSAAPPHQRGSLALELSAAAVAMVVFGLFAHRGLPAITLSVFALLVVAAVIGQSVREAASPRDVLGLTRFDARIAPFAIVAIAAGVFAGLLHRAQPGVLVDSAGGAQPFVVVACLIGATEELLYRGWLQGRASAFGWPAGVLIATVAHAAYKTAIFAWPPDSQLVEYDLVGIGLGTAAGGLVLGLLRVSSRSLLPAVLGHVAFDAVVYSSRVHAPWWVWR